MGEVARGLAAGATNVLVIGGDEDVSSYALMPGLTGGLVWISSIGADMVARGIPVLAAARPKYHAPGPRGRARAARPTISSAVERPGRHGGARRRRSSATRARRYLTSSSRSSPSMPSAPPIGRKDLFLEGPGQPPRRRASTGSWRATFPPRPRPSARRARWREAKVALMISPPVASAWPTGLGRRHATFAPPDPRAAHGGHLRALGGCGQPHGPPGTRPRLPLGRSRLHGRVAHAARC